MAEGDDHDQQNVVLHGVNDPIVPNPNAQARPAPERARPRWSGILGQEGYRTLNAWPHLRVEPAQRSDGGRADLDAIGRHAQPRSTFTVAQGMFGPSSAMASSKAATSSTSSSAFINCS